MSWAGAAMLLLGVGTAVGAPAAAPARPAAASARPASAAPRGVVNLNNATLAELARLPGVGLGKAGRIVERRKVKAFRAPEEVMDVKGFGRGLYKRLKPYLAVTGPTTLRAKVVDQVRPPRPARKAAPQGKAQVPEAPLPAPLAAPVPAGG